MDFAVSALSTWGRLKIMVSGFVMVIVAAVMVFAGVTILNENKRYTMRTPGKTIRDGTCTTHESKDDDGNTRQHTRCTAPIGYTVKGNAYEIQHYTDTKLRKGTSFRDIYYNPRNPSEAVVGKPSSAMAHGLFSSASVLSCCCIILVFVIGRSKTASALVGAHNLIQRVRS